MARSRVPAPYGVFQFCCRLLVFVVEICALAALVTLSKYKENYPLGYVTVSLMTFPLQIPLSHLHMHPCFSTPRIHHRQVHPDIRPPYPPEMKQILTLAPVLLRPSHRNGRDDCACKLSAAHQTRPRLRPRHRRLPRLRPRHH
jgi:hypothetical protein